MLLHILIYGLGVFLGDALNLVVHVYLFLHCTCIGFSIHLSAVYSVCESVHLLKHIFFSYYMYTLWGSREGLLSLRKNRPSVASLLVVEGNDGGGGGAGKSCFCLIPGRYWVSPVVKVQQN